MQKSSKIILVLVIVLPLALIFLNSQVATSGTPLGTALTFASYLFLSFAILPWLFIIVGLFVFFKSKDRAAGIFIFTISAILIWSFYIFPMIQQRQYDAEKIQGITALGLDYYKPTHLPPNGKILRGELIRQYDLTTHTDVILGIKNAVRIIDHDRENTWAVLYQYAKPQGFPKQCGIPNGYDGPRFVCDLLPDATANIPLYRVHDSLMTDPNDYRGDQIGLSIGNTFIIFDFTQISLYPKNIPEEWSEFIKVVNSLQPTTYQELLEY